MHESVLLDRYKSENLKLYNFVTDCAEFVTIPHENKLYEDRRNINVVSAKSPSKEMKQKSYLRTMYQMQEKH